MGGEIHDIFIEIYSLTSLIYNSNALTMHHMKYIQEYILSNLNLTTGLGFPPTLFVYLAISAATSAETVGICKSPDTKEELADVTCPAVDEDAL